ncbi:hypothetical protein C7271_11835 [filamentous cyanobacterium CCP5]|nr:hypothetical protein C7271_11835 [filamentous cyanobacterium CCP5]
MRTFKLDDKNTKFSRLAETVRLAIRAYGSGKQDASLKLIELVASQIESLDDRKALHRLVEAEIRGSELWLQYHRIMFGEAASASKGDSHMDVEPPMSQLPQKTKLNLPFWQLFQPKSRHPWPTKQTRPGRK